MGHFGMFLFVFVFCIDIDVYDVGYFLSNYQIHDNM